MKKSLRHKLNNDGSTLLFVIITIIFIGLLASLILALATSSFRMRNIDYNSRQNFYEGEEYSSKIYSDLGMNTVGILGESYSYAVGKLHTYDITSEKQLNDFVKELFYKNMIVYLGIKPKADINDITMSATYTVINADPIVTALQTRLQNIADNSADPEVLVTIKGDVVCNPEGIKKTDPATGAVTDTYPTITLNDVHIKYVKKANGFQSDFTFDLVVRYPEWDFKYGNPVSAKSEYDTFLDYVLICSDELTFDGDNAEGNAIQIKGSIASGRNSIVASNESGGITFKDSSNVSISTSESYLYSSMAVVATDNVKVLNSVTRDNSLSLAGGRIWCNSVILGELSNGLTASTTGATFISNNTRLYIQDDFQLDGDFSKASINNGGYYGFSSNQSDSNNKDVAGNVQNHSSAIIVNGNRSAIAMNNLNALYVSGLAYLDLDKNSGNLYRSGESLSVKGVQDMYLVPEGCMAPGYTNPTRTALNDTVTAQITANLLNSNTFWGSKYLDTTEPFIVKSANVLVKGSVKTYTFLYLNFKSKSDQSQYVVDFFKDGTADDSKQNLKKTKQMVKENLEEMMPNDVMKQNILSVDATSNMFTAGALVTAAGGNQGSASASAANITEVVLNNSNLRNRYSLMKALLLPAEDTAEDGSTYYLSNFSDVYTTLRDADGNLVTSRRVIDNMSLNRDMVTNFIDTARLHAYADPAGGVWKSVAYNVSGVKGQIAYVANDCKLSDLSLSGDVGIVVVDGDIIVNRDFTGLIIATGKIDVIGSVTLKNNAMYVDKIMTAEMNSEDPHSDVFYYYYVVNKLPNDAKSDIKALKYQDVLSYDNWRKY